VEGGRRHAKAYISEKTEGEMTGYVYSERWGKKGKTRQKTLKESGENKKGERKAEEEGETRNDQTIPVQKKSL